MSRLRERTTWYARRAAAMGPGELAVRTGRLVRDAASRPDPEPAVTGGWERALDRFRERPGILDRGHARALADRHPDGAADLLAAADRAREHRFRFFGLPEARYDGPVDWHRDALTGHHWPDRPARRIDHRTAAADPKWIWELNRLQHLPLLAQAWLLTGDDVHADEALAQLDAWITAAPPGRGIAWRGAFEAGVRAVSVVVALQGLRDSPALTPDRFRRAVRMLDASARRCWRDRSSYSSANNHLVGELAGLAAVAVALPELPDAARWERRALAGLAAEADRQILPDGAGAEQAAAYQVFTTELLAGTALALRVRDGGAPPALADAAARGAGYLCAVVGHRDPDPRYGDDDEGVALRLDAAPVRTVRAHLAAVAALTGHPDAAARGRPDLASGWFTRTATAGRAGPASAPVRSAVPAPGRAGAGSPAGWSSAGWSPAEPSAGPGAAARPGAVPARPVVGPTAGPDPAGFHAAHGGMVVFRSPGRRVTVDAGPLGHLSLAAHGHADALALTLALDGRDVVGDPGTASYYRHPDRRAAHRGTRVHPTVCVDGADQSTPGGPFLWTRHARTTVRAVDLAAGVVDAEHDGYAPLTHRRRVLCPPDGSAVLVLDLLSGPPGRRATTSWPLAPDLDLRPGHPVTRDGEPVLWIAQAATVRWTSYAVRGDEVTGLGWWSSRLEQREPSWLAGLELATSAPLTAVATLLGSTPVHGLSVTARDGLVTARWTEGERDRHATAEV